MGSAQGFENETGKGLGERKETGLTELRKAAEYAAPKTLLGGPFI